MSRKHKEEPTPFGPAINGLLFFYMAEECQCLPPSRWSEPSGPDTKPWAIWDLETVKVCGEPMSVQVTFTPPSHGDVKAVAISMYQTPKSRQK